MGFINLTGLTPGKTYDIAVRAKSPDGVVSANSVVYTFTAPSTNIDGTQLVATNNSVVSKIVSSTNFTASAYTPGTSVQGGALTAGPLDDSTLAIVGGINLLDYWNGDPHYIAYYISGSPDHGAVIINETGILGTKLNNFGSTPKFLLSTDTGDAYFAGTLSAPDGMIGGFHIGSTSLSNTVGDNTISINSGDSGYPNFQISGASSSIVISGDTYNPYIAMDNVNTNTEYSDLLIKAGSIASPDFGPTSTNNSRGEILFWGANSGNPNQITIRRFGESGTSGPDGQAFIDLSTNTISGTPDEIKIGIQASQSSSSETGNDITPNDNEKVSIEIYKAFGDTSTASYPAYLDLKVFEDGLSNTISMSANQTLMSTYGYTDGYALKVVSYQSSSGTTLISTPSFGNKPALILQGSSFPGNLLEFKNNSASTLSYFDRYGQFFGISSSALYAPNLTASTSNTQIANTAFVNTAIANHVLTQASAGYYGAFSSSVTQPLIAAGSAQPIILNQIDGSNGVSITNNASGSASRITFQYPGVYNIQWSGQFQNSDTSSEQDVSVWLKYNGTNVPGSNGVVTVPKKHSGVNGSVLPSWNFILTASAGDFYEFYWAANSTNISLAYLPPNTVPGTQSVIVTAQLITYIQSASTSGSVTIGSTTIPMGGSSTFLNGLTNISSSSGNFTNLFISGASVATQAYANSASLNAYNLGVTYANSASLSSYNLGITYSNSASLNAYNLGVTYSNSASLNAYNSASSYTQSSAWNNTSASVKYASSAGYLPVSGLSASTITIGSTAIGLGTTSASLGGLTNLSISTSGTSTSALTISESLSNNNLTGGTISIATSANATTATSPTGGAISITTTAGGSGVGLAGGGNITIQTSATGTGTAGSIAITSGIPGSIENMSIGATTPRAANFSSIGLVTPGTGYFTSGSFTSLIISDSATITLGLTPVTPGLIIKNQYLNQTANLLEFRSYTSSTPYTYFDNSGNLVSSGTASFSNKITAASFVGNGAGLTSITASNVSGTVGSAASVESTVIGGILNSSSNTFMLLTTPSTISAFGGASAITFGYQGVGTSTMNVGNISSNTGERTLNLFTTLGGSGGQNTINIGASGATAASIPQVINIGKATGAYNTITIGGATDTILNLNATASVTGKITAASVAATQVTGGGMDLIYSGTVTSTSGSVLIDNIFSSSYANYRVLFTTTSNGSNTSIYFKYANAGVASSSALYNYNMLSNATATQTSNSGSVIYHSIGAYATGATQVFEFYGPALTTTHMYKMEVYDSYSGGPTQQTVRGSYTNSSSFSGIVLATLSTAATLNGTVRVYGYHN